MSATMKAGNLSGAWTVFAGCIGLSGTRAVLGIDFAGLSGASSVGLSGVSSVGLALGEVQVVGAGVSFCMLASISSWWLTRASKYVA